MRSKFSPIEMNKIFTRDGGTCVYCGCPAMEIDHVIPLSMGGKTHSSNGVCSCRHCNRVKKNHMDDMSILYKAIRHLIEKGEDLSWMEEIV